MTIRMRQPPFSRVSTLLQLKSHLTPWPPSHIQGRSSSPIPLPAHITMRRRSRRHRRPSPAFGSLTSSPKTRKSANFTGRTFPPLRGVRLGSDVGRVVARTSENASGGRLGLRGALAAFVRCNNIERRCAEPMNIDEDMSGSFWLLEHGSSRPPTNRLRSIRMRVKVWRCRHEV